MSTICPQPLADTKEPFTDRTSQHSPSGSRELQPRGGDVPIRVLVADDHEFVRRGLRAILATDPRSFEGCAEAKSGYEAVEKARELQPDVVVLDVSMSGLN